MATSSNHESENTNRDETSSWYLIGKSSSLDVRSILIYLIPAAMNPLFVDRLLLGGSLIFWITVVIQAHIIYALCLLILRSFLFRKAVRDSRPVAVLMAITVGQSLRGTFIGLISISEGLTTDPRLLYRVVFGCAVLVPMAALIGLLVGIWDQHQSLITSLSRQSFQLIDLTQTMQKRIEEINNDIKTYVRKNITDRILELDRSLTAINPDSDLGPAIKELQVLMDEDLRPMSTTLSNSFGQNVEVVLRVPPVYERFRLPKVLKIRDAVFAKTCTLILIALQFAPSTRFLRGISLVAFFVYLCIATPLLVYSFRQIFSNRIFRTSISGVIICCFYVVINPLIIVSSRILNLSNLVHVIGLESILFAEAIVGFLFGFGCFGYAALTANRVQHIEELRKVTQELEVALSYLRQYAWSRRRQLATALHGNLQSALLVATIKLSAVERITPEDIVQIRSDIMSALRKIEELDSSRHSLQEFVTRTNYVWKNTIEIQWMIEAGAEQKLSESSELTESVSEVIREGITNAVKHSRSSIVEIYIGAVEREVRVQVRDNGHGIKEGYIPSLGLQFLNEVCISWALTQNSERGASLNATFACK